MAFRVAPPRPQRFREKAGAYYEKRARLARNFLNQLSFNVLSDLMLQEHPAEGKLGAAPAVQSTVRPSPKADGDAGVTLIWPPL